MCNGMEKCLDFSDGRTVHMKKSGITVDALWMVIQLWCFWSWVTLNKSSLLFQTNHWGSLRRSLWHWTLADNANFTGCILITMCNHDLYSISVITCRLFVLRAIVSNCHHQIASKTTNVLQSSKIHHFIAHGHLHNVVHWKVFEKQSTGFRMFLRSIRCSFVKISEAASFPRSTF
jgi:hypothetical protein